MGIFHYKAKLIKVKQSVAFYKFYPNFIGDHLSGEFKICLENWKTEIISYVEVEEENSFFEDRDKFYFNERPTSALTYKIKKHFEETGEIPEDVYYIA